MIALSIITLYISSFLTALAGMQSKHVRLKTIAYSLAILGFILHSFSLISSLFTNSIDNNDIFIVDFDTALTKGFYLQLLSWVLILIYIIFRRKLGIKLLTVSTMPLALIIFGLSFKVTNIKSTLPPELTKLFLNLHIGSFFISFALLVVGFGAGLFFIYSERKIKAKKTTMKELDPDLPALSSCDNVNRISTVIGFPLYTIGLASGFIWAGPTWGETLSWDIKEIISILNWLVFAFLFYQRLVLNTRGKKAALLLMFVFTIAAASLLSNFFIDSHHSFFN